MTERKHFLDLTRCHFQRTLGDIQLYGTWVPRVTTTTTLSRRWCSCRAASVAGVLRGAFERIPVQ